MTETNDAAPSPDKSDETAQPPARSGRKSGGLSSKLLPELKQIAGGLGIRATGLKKADLVAAIQQAQQSGQAQQGQQQGRVSGGNDLSSRDRQGKDEAGTDQAGKAPSGKDQLPARQQGEQGGQQDQRAQRQDRQQKSPQADQGSKQDQPQDRKDKNAQQDQQQDRGDKGQKQDRQKGQHKQDGPHDAKNSDAKNNGEKNDSGKNDSGKNDSGRNESRNAGHQQDQQDQQDDDGGGSRRNRRRRGRDRTNQPGQGQGHQAHQGQQGGGRGRNEPDLTVLEDDVLAPCAGILDVLDNYAFVRTTGYLPGDDDVYVAMSMVRKFGLRRGDAVTGQVRQPREGERREKFNPLVELDSVNGAEPESSKDRVEFASLTPVHPSDRLRMETDRDNVVGRVIDLVAPIGKGQRGLIAAPAKAGRTTVLKSIAASITANHAEAHLMVVLVDERPEEVTDFQRSVRGEVISSTFDRPAADHATVAELAIERAQRLVELGHDVVILLDGLTRLGRAYNLMMPNGGRVLPSGVDAAAIHPPKRLFGAARNIEDGGSLTILGTVVVDSGVEQDQLFFEEFSNAANLELRLRRDPAHLEPFPAIDPAESGTRHEELLMGDEERTIVTTLRRSLAGQDSAEAQASLMDRLAKSQNNIDLLRRVQQGANPSSV